MVAEWKQSHTIHGTENGPKGQTNHLRRHIHRWNTPLNGIQAAAEQLIETLQWALDNFHRRTNRLEHRAKHTFSRAKAPIQQAAFLLQFAHKESQAGVHVSHDKSNCI